MSRKILSQAGTSLADVYDIEGSVAGLHSIDVDEIKGVHELGGQIHSERLVAFLTTQTTGGVLQNTTFANTSGSFPDSINRIMHLSVLASVGARLAHVSVAFQDTASGREIPIWVWDNADDRDQAIEWSNDGAGATTVQHLSTLVTHLPTLMTRVGTPRLMGALILRGLTSGFGAGTVTVFLVTQILRPNPAVVVPGDPSSHGLPIPSW